MDTVGRHLQVHALALHKQGSDADLFARSAYNRYYYATFLIVRETVSSLDSAWIGLPHKNYPELLEGKILTKISTAKRRAVSLSDQKLIRSCQSATNAIKLLAELMRSSSSVRVLADYEPETKISFEGNGRFKLSGVDITVADQWPVRAKAFASIITDTWRQLIV